MVRRGAPADEESSAQKTVEGREPAADRRDACRRGRGRHAEGLERDAAPRGDLGRPSAFRASGARTSPWATSSGSAARRSSPRPRGSRAISLRIFRLEKDDAGKFRWREVPRARQPGEPRRGLRRDDRRATSTATENSTSSSAATAPARPSPTTAATGRFRIETRGLPRELSTRAIAIGDLNGDGRNDLLVISDDAGGSGHGRLPDARSDGYLKGFDVRACPERRAAFREVHDGPGQAPASATRSPLVVPKDAEAGLPFYIVGLPLLRAPRPTSTNSTRQRRRSRTRESRSSKASAPGAAGGRHVPRAAPRRSPRTSSARPRAARRKSTARESRLLPRRQRRDAGEAHREDAPVDAPRRRSPSATSTATASTTSSGPTSARTRCGSSSRRPAGEFEELRPSPRAVLREPPDGRSGSPTWTATAGRTSS